MEKMIKVKLHGPKNFGGKLYPVGQHELPESVVNGWFFQGLVAGKHAAIVAEVKPQQPLKYSADPLKPEAVEKSAEKPGKAKQKG